MKEKNSYLIKNTVIFAISSFGTKFLSFFMIPLYTNILSTSDYGIADLITTTGTLLIFVCTINIADSVLRFSIDEKCNDKEAILSFGLRVLVVGSLVVCFILSVIYKFKILNWPVQYYIFIWLYFIFVALNQILSNYLRAIDKVKEVAVAGILSSLFIILGNVVFLLIIKWGIVGYLISLILGPLISCIYSFTKIGCTFKILVNSVCERKVKYDMILYCAPLIFNNIALWINAYLDRYFVTGMCGADQNGIYSAASKIPTILSTCYSIFTQAWTLSAIKEFDKDDKEGFFSQTYNIYSALIVVVCSIIILFNIPLAKILYAKDFFIAWRSSSILLLSVMFNAFTAFLGSVFGAVKKTNIIAYTTIFSAVINIVLNVLLIAKWRIQGAAIATVVAYVVMWAIRLVVIKKYIHLKLNLVRDCLAYSLLVIQVILEHYQSHLYIGQIVIFVIVLCIYRKYLIEIINVLLKTLKQKVGKNNAAD